MTAAELHKLLLTKADPEKATLSQRFFKTGPGQYGEGDRFMGVIVPNIRQVAKEGKAISLKEIEKLLHSRWHEDRLLAVVLLVMQFKKGDDAAKKNIYDLYLANTTYVNNWDIVDSSARQIVGGYLFGYPNVYPKRYPWSRVLTDLAMSSSMWERRIAMIATFYWLAKGESEPTIQIAELLINDKEDLMHKAVGWSLREMGKQVNADVLREFLAKHAVTMPRTTLRYAIEHFSPDERKMWLAKRSLAGVS